MATSWDPLGKTKWRCPAQSLCRPHLDRVQEKRSCFFFSFATEETHFNPVWHIKSPCYLRLKEHLTFFQTEEKDSTNYISSSPLDLTRETFSIDFFTISEKEEVLPFVQPSFDSVDLIQHHWKEKKWINIHHPLDLLHLKRWRGEQVKCAASGQGVRSTAVVANLDLLLKMCGGALLVCYIFSQFIDLHWKWRKICVEYFHLLLCLIGFVYIRVLSFWAFVLVVDFLLEFRLELLWPLWLLLTSVYDSFKYQGLVSRKFQMCKLLIKIRF